MLLGLPFWCDYQEDHCCGLCCKNRLSLPLFCSTRNLFLHVFPNVFDIRRSYFGPIVDAITGDKGGDYYLVANDFPSYLAAQDQVDRTYKDQKKWIKMSILSTAGSGKFSSDRTIQEYADQIWKVKGLPRPASH